MTEIIAVVGLALACGLWVLIQRKHGDAGGCGGGGCGACGSGRCSKEDSVESRVS
ncbi:MAG: hypothetical protein R3B13_04440 [Polyangiaceae bacterium]